jgi:hypothetical protein
MRRYGGQKGSHTCYRYEGSNTILHNPDDALAYACGLMDMHGGAAALTVGRKYLMRVLGRDSQTPPCGSTVVYKPVNGIAVAQIETKNHTFSYEIYPDVDAAIKSLHRRGLVDPHTVNPSRKRVKIGSTRIGFDKISVPFRDDRDKSKALHSDDV